MIAFWEKCLQRSRARVCPRFFIFLWEAIPFQFSFWQQQWPFLNIHFKHFWSRDNPPFPSRTNGSGIHKHTFISSLARAISAANGKIWKRNCENSNLSFVQLGTSGCGLERDPSRYVISLVPGLNVSVKVVWVLALAGTLFRFLTCLYLYRTVLNGKLSTTHTWSFL